MTSCIMMRGERKRTQRYAEQANTHLNRRYYEEDELESTADNPVVCVKGQDETENVLEDNHQSKTLDGQVTCNCTLVASLAMNGHVW